MNMKAQRKGEEMIKVGLRFPRQIKEVIDDIAVRERRLINDQVIVLLEKALELLNPPDES